MFKHMICSAIAGALSSLPVQAQENPFVEAWIYYGEKCGPLRGKDFMDLTLEEQKECTKPAQVVADLFGLGNGGFSPNPHFIRDSNKIQNVVSLWDEASCDATSHSPENNKYKGQATISAGSHAMICTSTIPISFKVTKITCEVDGGGIARESCRSNGDFSDCSWVATVHLTGRAAEGGRKYCWWAYNQADLNRTFSVSVK